MIYLNTFFNIRNLIFVAVLSCLSVCVVAVLEAGQASALSLSPQQHAAINIKESDFKEIPSPQSGTQIFTKILNAVYTVVAVISVIVIVAAGIIYITSEGESQKTKMAKDAIIYAIVGLVIVGSAFIITGVIQAVGAKPPTP